MSQVTILQMIPLIQKAANVCGYCRVRKQKCDRTLPRCARCAAKSQDCDYTPPPQSLIEPEPLVRLDKICGHADLTPHGASEFVNAVKACMDAVSHSDTTAELVDLAAEILNSVGFNLSQALTTYGPAFQQWCPILVEDHIFGSCDFVLKEPVNPQEGTRNPVIWMALWLVGRKPCSPQENMGSSELYVTLKKVHGLLQSSPNPELLVLQLGMMIALYEIGHGLRQQAFQTIGTCVATLTLLEIEAERTKHDEMLDIFRWIRASVAILDRQLPLTMITGSLPLNMPPGHHISKYLRASLATGLPAPPPRPHASSPRKVFIRTGACVAAGFAVEYVYNRQQHYEIEKSYDEVDAIANRCMSMLIVKPDSAEMFQCDAVPMTFCSHMILQQAHMRHLLSIYPDAYSQDPAPPELQKAIVALRFSRNMAWQMVCTAIQLVKSEEMVPSITFAGLCSVLRAGLAVLETRSMLVDNEVIEAGELEAFMKLVQWFSRRWMVGMEFLGRFEEVLGPP